MMPTGFFAAMSAAVAVCGTISLYTPASRTRRAISWAYWAPKSTTRTGRWEVSVCSVNGCFLSDERLVALLGGSRLGEGRVRGEIVRRGRGFARLALGQVALHLAGDARLEEEREERHDAAGREQQEAPEVPAHEAPHAEAREEVHDVE